METKKFSTSTFFSRPQVSKGLDSALKNFKKLLASLVRSTGHEQLQMCLVCVFLHYRELLQEIPSCSQCHAKRKKLSS